MNGVVGLRLIGTADEVAAVMALLSIAVAGTGVRVATEEHPYPVRGNPVAVRVYAEVVLPAGLPDAGVR
jgi:hypothetical protein